MNSLLSILPAQLGLIGGPELIVIFIILVFYYSGIVNRSSSTHHIHRPRGSEKESKKCRRERRTRSNEPAGLISLPPCIATFSEKHSFLNSRIVSR